MSVLQSCCVGSVLTSRSYISNTMSLRKSANPGYVLISRQNAIEGQRM